MTDYIESFCKEFNYPEEAKNTFVNAYKDIFDKSEAKLLFCLNTELFLRSGFFNGEEVLLKLNDVSELTGIHKYTVYILFYICLSEKLRDEYHARGIEYSVFYDSMYDLRCKLFECYNMYGIWGAFAAYWFMRFFTLERFALGRMQYELISYPLEDYEKDGYSLKKGDNVLNMHIPSNGIPLSESVCRESYELAKNFYNHNFIGKPTAFMCESWLLYPKQTEFLPKNSNILRFMSDFDIVKYRDTDEFRDAWRIFNMNYSGDPAILPTDTSLRRAYVDWLKSGGSVGIGIGVFFLK